MDAYYVISPVAIMTQGTDIVAVGGTGGRRASATQAHAPRGKGGVLYCGLTISHFTWPMPSMLSKLAPRGVRSMTRPPV